jgi:hypothetical protein
LNDKRRPEGRRWPEMYYVALLSNDSDITSGSGSAHDLHLGPKLGLSHRPGVFQVASSDLNRHLFRAIRAGLCNLPVEMFYIAAAIEHANPGQ